MSKVYTRFQTEKRKNHIPPWGGTYLYGLYIREYLPGENLSMLKILSEDLGAL